MQQEQQEQQDQQEQQEQQQRISKLCVLEKCKWSAIYYLVLQQALQRWTKITFQISCSELNGIKVDGQQSSQNFFQQLRH